MRNDQCAPSRFYISDQIGMLRITKRHYRTGGGGKEPDGKDCKIKDLGRPAKR